MLTYVCLNLYTWYIYIYTCIRIAKNINLAPFCMGSLHPMIPDPSWYTSKDKFLADVERIALWSAFLVIHPVSPLSVINWICFSLLNTSVQVKYRQIWNFAQTVHTAHFMLSALLGRCMRSQRETRPRLPKQHPEQVICQPPLAYAMAYSTMNVLAFCMVSIYSTAAFAKVSCGFFSSGIWYSCSKNESWWVSQGRSLQNSNPASN